MELPFDVIKTILTNIPESQRYFCRLVSKAWLAWVDTSVTQIDLSKRKILEIMTDSCDFPVIKPNAERISKAERVLMMAARRFTNLKKIKLGAEPKSVRTTYIALPAVLKTEDERSDLHPVHPLMESFNKKRALDDFAPILQEVNEAVNRHKFLSENLLWNDLSLKRVRDDIDPMIIVHLVKNCPKLTELNLYGITRVTDDILAAIVDLRPNITQLNLINTSVSVLGLEYALNKLPNLENLTIGRTISSGYILCQPHRNFPANEMLKLKDLDVWKRLRKLRLSYFSLNDMTPLFSGCTNLVKFHDVGVHATVLPFKTTFPKLTSLDVEISSFDVETFIAKHPQLEDISLRGLVTSAHINAITNNVIKLTKLRISVYWEAEISTESMRALLQKHAKTMKSLELCEIRTIDPDVLDFKFPALKTLVVKLCSKISGSHVAKLVPRKVGNIEYSDCIQKLLTMDVSKLEENGSYANFQYYDEKNDFNLRTTIGSPCDPAWW